MKRLTTCLFFLSLTATYLSAQSLSTPPSGDNQKCIVTQYIGSLAHVTVKYNSPDVTGPNGEDRTGHIWGELVPYGMTTSQFGLGNPAPWRVGANENTVIKFSHDVLVEGKPLAAGKYGLHLIVQESGPWTWIFSRNTQAWGSYFYDETEDALQVDAMPGESAFHEWLTFEFTDRQPESAVLAMRWENKSVPMRIEVQGMNDLYVEAFDKELQGQAGFMYQNWATAANFLAQRDYKLDKALEWADAAISQPFTGQANWTTLQTKANVLSKMGKDDKADEVMAQAIDHPTATPFQIHQYGRQLITQGNAEKALKVFEKNYTKFDAAWPTNVGMARGLSAVGKYDEALKYAKLAYEEAPDELNKNSMQSAIEQLKQKQDIN